MKILFVVPINRTYVIAPLLGLGYLASIARKKHDVTILDCKKEKMDYDNFTAYIKKNHFDLIGFQLFTYDLNSVKKHIEIIKSINDKCIVVAGGSHPSGSPRGTLEYLKDLDFAFRGESEVGFEKFIDFLEDEGNKDIRHKFERLRNIPGLVFRSENAEIIANEPEYVQDLDSLDFPSWDLMNPLEYPEAPHGAFCKQFPVAPIIITRGCPNLCTFCAGKAISGSKIRKRSIDNVMAEIRYLQEHFGIKELLIEDENFTLHKDLLSEFCTKLIDSGMGLSWGFPSGVRLDTLDEKGLKLMEQAGCYSVSVGIEFGSQRIHDLTRKNLTIEKIEEKIKLLAKTNIKVTGFFLMGIPGETKEDILQTVKLALKLDLDRVQINNFMPLPGSQLWRSLEEEGLLNQIDWDRFFVHDVAFPPKGVSSKDLKNIQRNAYMRFYLRPRVLKNLLSEIRSFRHFRFLLKRFLDAMK